jgi:hypothetical protein
MPNQESLYGEDEPSPAPNPNGEEGGGDPKGDDQGKQTAVLPAEMCPGMKAGDEIKLRIVSADEDSYEVSYEPEDKGPEKGASEPQAEVPEGSMASMMN